MPKTLNRILIFSLLIFIPFAVFASSQSVDENVTINGYFTMTGGALSMTATSGFLNLSNLSTSLINTGANSLSLIGSPLYLNATGTGNTSIGSASGTVTLTVGSDAIGDIYYRNSSGNLARLADVATGSAMISGGINLPPSWGKLALASVVTGTLSIANGGTGTNATPTAGGMAFGNGTAYAFTGAATAGLSLLSGGAGTPTWGYATANAAGSNTQVQFNNNGLLGADANFIWDNTNKSLEVGIGTFAPATYKLAVANTMQIDNTNPGTNVSQLIFTHTAGTGDFVITGDGNDIYWQGGGSRALQMGSYWPTIIAGDSQTTVRPAFQGASCPGLFCGISTIIVNSVGRTTDVTLVSRGIGSQTGDLQEWQNSAGTALLEINSSGTVTTPSGTALNMTSGGTGAINIGTDSNAKTITIGNNTGTTALNFISGTGNISFSVNGSATRGLITMGNSNSATPDLLVLDSGTANPTGANGGMYYNTISNKFRCYENGAWKDCVNASSLPSGTVNNSTLRYDTGTSAWVENTNFNVTSGGIVTSGTWNATTIGTQYGGTGDGASPISGAVAYGNGTAYAFTATGTAGQVLQSNGASSPTWSTAKYPAVASTTGNYLMSNGTNFVSTALASGQFIPADPASTTSAVGVMMGLGNTATIKPVITGDIIIIISGDMTNYTAPFGAQTQIRYGTGAAPANGAALTGTAVGGLIKMQLSNGGANATKPSPFSLNAIIPNLTIGTTYWIDTSLAQVNGGTAGEADVSISVMEF